MPKTLFDPKSIKSLRDEFKRNIPGTRSSHLAEAIAAGFGFRNNAVLQEALRGADLKVLAYRDFDTEAFTRRMAELGVAVQPGFMDFIGSYMRGSQVEMLRDPRVKRVAPRSMERPREVARAMRRWLIFSPLLSEMITAAFHGFTSFRALEAAIAEGPSNAADEECEGYIAEARIQNQAMILNTLGGIGVDPAVTAIEILRPTAMQSHGRMEDMDRKLLEYLRRKNPNQRIELGENEEFRRSLRSKFPPDLISATMLLQVLPALGWAMSDLDVAKFHELGVFSYARARGGRLFQVCFSPSPYVPGIGSDAGLTAMKRRLEGCPQGSVIFFGQALYWQPDPHESSVAFGGLLWDGERWSSFVLRPNGGIDDALAQRGEPVEAPTPEFLRKFADREAVRVATSLGAALSVGEPGMASITGLKTGTGWLLAMVRQASPAEIRQTRFMP